MTFRPTDDILEEMNGSQTPQWWAQYTDYGSSYNADWSAGYWQQNFQQNQNTYDNWTQNPEDVLKALNIPIEEVKAPDLNDLLSGNGAATTEGTVQSSPAPIAQQPVQPTAPVVDPVNNADVAQNPSANPQEISHNFELDLWDKISDAERTAIVMKIDGAVSSNFDFLVDEQWINAIDKYKKIHRIIFRRWALIIASVIWLWLGVYAQMDMDQPNNFSIINDASIENKVRWKDNTVEKDLSVLINSGVDLEIEMPYGAWATSSDHFYSKNNLLKYKWIVLPQLASINYNSEDFISSGDFYGQKTTRQDIENLVKYLVTDKSITNNIRKHIKVYDSRWKPNKFGKWGLIEWFSLGCVDSYKVSDLLCDKFLEAFYKYGKYYEISNNQYSSEILSLSRKLKEEWKDIEPICSMINEYTLVVGKISSNFDSIMQNCKKDEYEFYNKLVNFIELENSLTQPELSDRVFDDPDLNAYKLLSAQQTVYKSLNWNGAALNENYIKSYLNYAQALLNKDNKTGRYLDSIYKDMLYVFNMDELYQIILVNGKSDIKLQMDQINNGNALYKYPWLLSQLVTADIVTEASELSGSEAEEVTIENIFSQYYWMKDRLKIRSVTKRSDSELVVKTELFTKNILKATGDQSLKLTVTLRRNGNVLYVSNIKVATQPKLTDILNIQAEWGNTSFNAMMWIIDEQVGMWYETPSDDEVQPTLCDQLQAREDLSVYVCDDSSISLYKWELEYNFELVNGALNSYTVDDEKLQSQLEDRLKSVMLIKDNTPTIIMSIIDFEAETTDDTLEQKLDVIDQFRIHFKLIPDSVKDIEWEPGKFLVNFVLWKFKMQWTYDVKTRTLNKVSYVNCNKVLEIKGFSIPITKENEEQMAEISNNPQTFFVKLNAAAYKKYQKLCKEE